MDGAITASQFGPFLHENIETKLKQVFAHGKEITCHVDFKGPWGLKFYECRLVPEITGGEVLYVDVFSKDLSSNAQ